MRRWTGFNPSRASGSALETMTDMEYSRNERSISSWMSMGSMAAKPASPFPLPSSMVVSLICSPPPLDIEEANVLGVRLDEVAAKLHIIAHQDRAHLVGDRRLLQLDLEEGPLGRIHRRLLQLAEVHLPEAL